MTLGITSMDECLLDTSGVFHSWTQCKYLLQVIKSVKIPAELV